MAKTPAYRQLYAELKSDIKNGKYPPGIFLPTESELEQIFGVSRTTVRRAISMLTAEGYLSVKQGRGTEVQEVSTAQRLNTISSFTETIKRRGYTAVSYTHLDVYKRQHNPLFCSLYKSVGLNRRFRQP